MNYLLTFAPWIAFAALSGTAGWSWGALAALAVSVAVILRQRRGGAGFDALVLELSSAAFFVALSAVAFAAPHSTLRHYTGGLSLGWLALTAWATLAIGRPFTLAIARRSVPATLWNHSGFVRVNVVLTTVWAAAFTASGLAMATAVATGAGAAVTTSIQVLGFVLPMAFTVRYPAMVQERARRQGGGQSLA